MYSQRTRIARALDLRADRNSLSCSTPGYDTYRVAQKSKPWQAF